VGDREEPTAIAEPVQVSSLQYYSYDYTSPAPSIPPSSNTFSTPSKSYSEKSWVIYERNKLSERQRAKEREEREKQQEKEQQQEEKRKRQKQREEEIKELFSDLMGINPHKKTKQDHALRKQEILTQINADDGDEEEEEG
jgi:hypothetical protein